MKRRWFVVDTRVWEVEADDEGEAIALVDESPDLSPACRTTTAEPVAAWTRHAQLALDLPTPAVNAGLRVLR